MEMEDQYGMADLRQYINGRAHFPAIPPSGDLFSGQHRNLTQPHHHYDMSLVDRHHQVGADHMLPPRGLHQHEFASDSTAAAAAVSGATCGGAGAAAAAASSGSLNGLEMESGGGGFGGGDGGTGRWPRQETLTLLEIRSRLDSKFKEANHKGPLWDEISRIMYEENGYQRSGKKCREKFENLYKYYKKTKEGKAGRQDGKHYRFFRQLEALYGDTNHPASVSETHYAGNNFLFHNPSNNTLQGNQEPSFQAPKLSDSLSNPSEFDSSSSDDNEIDEAGLMDTDSTEKEKKKRRRGRRSWKTKIRDFIDLQMRKMMEKQEEWLEKMSNTLEKKEQERMLREEEWRKLEVARMERQHKLWVNERAWIEARNASLIEALQKLTGKEIPSLNENQNDGWSDCEITKLVQLRASMDSRFEQSDHGSSEEALWEEIAAKMAYLGYERSSSMCKEKWDRTSIYLRRTKECNKRTCCYFQNNNEPILYNIHHQGGGGAYCEINAPIDDGGASPYFFVGADHQPAGGDNLWNNYGDKLSKGGSH